MNSKSLIIGISLIIIGGSVFSLYSYLLKPEHEARALITESRLIMERGDKDSYNQTINTLRNIFVKYPGTKAVPEAYFMTAQSYEKLGLYRIAYLKYSYLLRQPLAKKTSDQIKAEASIHMNKIRILRSYTEEGVHNLYNMLGTEQTTDLRSKIYAEIGQAYLKKGDLPRAKSSFDIALQENTANEEALLGKARSLKRSGLDDEAFLLYDYFLKYYGAVSPYTADVTRTYANELYDSGIRAYRAGSYYRSVDYFNRFLSRFGGGKYSENAYYWAGESYYSLRSYDNAVRYFDRVLSNNYYHKDEDARIKKGMALFMMKRYDLAAKEFQTYLRDYPRGRFVPDARKWKDMSANEIGAVDQPLIPNDKKTPDKGSDIKKPDGQGDDSTVDTPSDKGDDQKDNPYGNEEVGGDIDGIELDNITEM
jgi:outer membrane protein assembly factor BamD (BamD/ComL family)